MQMNYYMIKCDSIKNCRLTLKKLNKINFRQSSLYIFDNNYYTVIAISPNEVVNLVYSNVFITLDNISDYNFQFITDELDIIEWAKSEITKSITWLHYENKSILYDGYGRKYGNILRSFKPLTETMSIINYTPDSFSDGGMYNSVNKAITKIINQIRNGADIIDLGVESTNHNAKSLSAMNELSRLNEILPEIKNLKSEFNFRLSIDTYHNENIAYLLDNDVDIINDVSGNLSIDSLKLIQNGNKTYIAMHSLSVPVKKDMVFSLDVDPVNEIYQWMTCKLEQLLSINFDLGKIILDPGIGFGTNPEQAWYVLCNIDKFMQLPCEILVGHSRKSMFNHIINLQSNERDIITNHLSCQLANKNIGYLRLHDIKHFYQCMALPKT